MEESTERIWNNFHDRLFNFIYKRVKDKDAANDILQEVFLKIHLKLDTLKEEEKLHSWLYQITRNTVTDFFNKTKKFDTVEDNIPDLQEEEPLNYEFLKCISPFVEELDIKYKEAILATDLGELSQKEYAERANISYSGAKSRIQRARQQLKEVVNQCCTLVIDRYGNVIEKTGCKKICGCD